MKFDALTQEQIEEGRETPFVQGLVVYLETEQRDLLVRLRDGMASPGTMSADFGRVTAGRAMAVRDLILKIRGASGREEE